MPLRKETSLPVSPLHFSSSAIPVGLGKARMCSGTARKEKSVLTDVLTTTFFPPRLSVGFIVIQEYPFEGLVDELIVCLKLFSKLPYLIGFVTFIYN